MKTGKPFNQSPERIHFHRYKKKDMHFKSKRFLESFAGHWQDIP
jgi:hypothetical protein